MGILNKRSQILFSFLLLFSLPSFSITEVLKVKLSGNNYYDETAIRFIQGATQGFDSNWDAHKFFSLNPNVPQVYTRCGITDYAINAFGPIASDTTIELRMIIPATGVYTILGIPFGAFPPGTIILLEDLSDGSTYDLLSNISHPFQMDTVSYGGSIRFVVHFDYPILTSLNTLQEKINLISVYHSGENQINILDASGFTKAICLMDLSGKVLTEIRNSEMETKIELPAMCTGIVMVRIQVGEEFLCKKITTN